MHESFERLLAAFAVRTGLDSVKATPQGICNLFFDGLPLTLQYLPESGSLLLFSCLGKLPDEGREAFCLTLLEANHFFSGTGGATLSAQRSTGLVALHQTVPMQILDEARFLQILETYMNTAEHWAKALAEYETPQPAPGEGNTPGTSWMPV